MNFLKISVFFALLLPIIVSCSDSNKEQLPVDFVWDREVCERCKMAISSHNYSVQVIDGKGEALFFDDIGCSILWLNEQALKDKVRIWVNDVKTTEWIEAKNAHWISGDPNTPMGFGFAATLSPVTDSLNYEMVKKQVLSGNTLANTNMEKHQKHPSKHSND